VAAQAVHIFRIMPKVVTPVSRGVKAVKPVQVPIQSVPPEACGIEVTLL
jgi:hypothetical protein